MMIVSGKNVINISGKGETMKEFTDIVLTILAIICVLIIIKYSSSNKDEEYCYNCQKGFCMLIPKSKECQEYREVHKG